MKKLLGITGVVLLLTLGCVPPKRPPSPPHPPRPHANYALLHITRLDEGSIRFWH
ncbi:MAG: hypothetical protein JO154_02780 [Chitinophaga sp.]|uniref:hypothetical protein n=1 Tax=Chitinophaga sp. TaxID=1869181 RepID=UPI0025BEB9FF|nr:hypothetical protein [Chitinophaga sp.]MBV8251506.1 hypothetical protein [Chitinophaga sp.]